MKVVVVIQARTASSRLPGKVLLPVCGRPLLALMLERVAFAREPDAIVVATTTANSDDAIVTLCDELGVASYRGDPLDCLDRHLQVARRCGADAVAKVPSDCPLVDPRVIDQVIGRYRAARGDYDYCGNLHPASWPDGNDIEVISTAALERAARETSDAFDREHTTPFFWSQPERFRLGNVSWDLGIDCSQRYRWSVDWPEDLELVRTIFAQLLPFHGPGFSAEEILLLHARKPELESINARHRGYNYASTRPSSPRASVPLETH